MCSTSKNNMDTAVSIFQYHADIITTIVAPCSVECCLRCSASMGLFPMTSIPSFIIHNTSEPYHCLRLLIAAA